MTITDQNASTTGADTGAAEDGGGSGRPSILIVSHYYPPHVGGIERAVQTQAEHLAAAGHHVTVASTAPGGRVGTESAGPDLEIVRVPTWNQIEDTSRVPFPVITPRAVAQLRRLVHAADIVHVHDLFYVTTWSAVLLAVLRGKPVVLTQHVHMIDHPSRLVMAVQRLVYRFIGRAILRRVAAVCYLNATVREFLLALGARPEQLHFVPNLVDTEQFRPAVDHQEVADLRRAFELPPEEILAIFVGRFVPKKGFTMVAGAAGCGATLVMVGGDREESGEPERPGVLWLGARGVDDVARLYRACDIFVLPSVSEGFPLTVQEAMASGLAVITTDDPGYRLYDLDRQRVSLIEPTQEVVTAELSRVSGDVVLRERMRRYARSYAVTQFSATRYVAALTDTYRQVGETAPSSQETDHG